MEKKELEKIFKAFANRRRLTIVSYLKQAGERNVNGVAAELDLSIAATSRHLVNLERTGILEKQQRDKEVFYRLAQQKIIFINEIFKEL